jgi:ribose/xylose/arabinose/galactoside ABC-type transport system permease subunit
MDYTLTLLNFDAWLQSLPTGALLVVACLALGYVLKWLPWVENRFIPVLVVVAGMVMALLLAERGDLPLRAWVVRHLILGLVSGCVAWLVHNKLLKRIETKLFGEKENL